MGRFECHAHTMYSNIRLLDCINSPEKLIDYAAQIGLTGIAITDHEALGCHVAIDKYQKVISEKYPNFKIAKGNEIYLTDTRDSNQRYWHFILIAKNKIGHKMLRELSSTAWINSYTDRRMERVPTLKSELQEIIEKYGKGNLIASSACLGSEIDNCILEMHYAEQNKDKESKRFYFNKLVTFIQFCLDCFGKDFYLEVQPAQSEEQLIVNRKMPEIAKYFGIKMIVSTDAHYLKESDREVHKAYLNSKGGERETDSFYKYAYLQTTEEVIENLQGTGLNYQELEDNTNEIYNKIEIYSFEQHQQIPQVEVKDYPKEALNHHKYDSKKYPTLDYLMHSDNLQERYWINSCQEALIDKNINKEEYLERLEEEADINKVIGEKLNTCMFAYPIFLQHYINLFWECGSTVGAGRGSACSGLNHYLLGVTQLDPIQWKLPYWRYSNKERIELGDIDIDICPSKRELIFEKIREERGQLGCVQVCTYGTETTKSAIKTACRGYRSKDWPEGIDVDIAEYLSSLVPQERGFLWTLSDVVYGNKEKDRKPVKTFLVEVNKYPGLLDIMINIEGLVCRRGVHASGVNFYGKDPYETACFMKARNGAITTQYSLHDAEFCGDVKYDFLVTEIQDVLVQWIQLVQEHNLIDNNLSIKEVYDKYLHPDKLPIEDNKIWEAAASGKILKLFQFDTQVGGQTIKVVKPHSPKEMADCNSAMRLMAAEKGGETPTERYVRMKKDISQWYIEMDSWNLTREEQKILEPYYLPTYASPAQQEDMMLILMDDKICNFSLADANAARKIVGKKQMDKIPELHKKVLESAPNKNFGEYVWETALKPQMGYSFSLIHSLAYSFIGLQTVYAATYFPTVYWNTACLRVDSGLDEEASTNYGKIARAVGNMFSRDIMVSLIDINKSQYMFEPDEENNAILYGMKALNGVGGEIIQEIIQNRPYNSVQDFQDKVKVNKTVMISLIKSGAFDQFGNRKEIMEKYLREVSEPKKRLTLQNFNGLIEKDLVPQELNFQKRVFRFNKALRKNKYKDYFILRTDNFYNFYTKFFDVDKLVPVENKLGIEQKEWKKIYDSNMLPAKTYLQKHQKELLDDFNNELFQEQWTKYALGSYSTWEMDSLGMYYHKHELAAIDKKAYEIVPFKTLSEQPIIDYTFKRNGIEIPIFKTFRIAGTVVAKDDAHSSISVLTPESGVITVKLSRDYFARYNRRISEVEADGTKKVKEAGWFQKGTLVVLNGIRRGDSFFCKKYSKTKYHQLYKITNVYKDGLVDMTNKRYGEEEEAI